ncbi:hypothetical protein BG003_007016 [Podila horticola]|nr:hypothetical protein BG003_007016 [Podila horticola]
MASDDDTSSTMTTQSTETAVSKPSIMTDSMDKTLTTVPDTDTTMKEPSLSSPTPDDTKPTPTPTSAQSDNTSRPEKRRLANNGEDTRRNKRMMGMILGTLAQSKRATPLPSTATTAAGTTPGTGVQTGMTSREAIQARVREKLEREKKLYQEQEAQERAERQKLWAERNEQRQRQKEALQSRRPALDEVARSGVARGRLPTTRDTRSAPRWTGTDYILTETKPRLRYLPKVLNATTKEKLEAQTRERALGRERERGRIRDRAPVDPRKEEKKEEDKEDKEGKEEDSESKTESETTTTKMTVETENRTEEKTESKTKDEKLETMDLDSDLVVDVQKSPADDKENTEEGKSTEVSTSASTAPVSKVKDAKADDGDMDMEPKKDGPELINISLV